ncbi:hypothetical protein Lal_00038629 [Lupinus albus]|nr:hypothetical protein Lal_00038629 [Lupinus albus]
MLLTNVGLLFCLGGSGSQCLFPKLLMTLDQIIGLQGQSPSYIQVLFCNPSLGGLPTHWIIIGQNCIRYGIFLSPMSTFVTRTIERGKVEGGMLKEDDEFECYQSSDPRLSERFSPERERFTWEGEILGYTGGFSLEREMSRLGEKWHLGLVDTVRFSLERESLP